MNGRIQTALVAAALVAAGCSSTPVSSRGGMSGSHDMAMTDKFIFLTSADTNDLRVLRLDVPNSPNRAFVQAPNPLEALMIPTIDRPTEIVTDDRWVGGQLAHGTYVFVSRAGGSEISVVGAAPEEFREVRRVVTAGAVTATTAVRLDDTTSRLYYATFDGTLSTLFSVDLPVSTASLRAMTAAQLTAATKIVVSLQTDAVAALLVVPPVAGRTLDKQPFCDTGNHCIVIASRRSGGTDGSTVMFDPVTLKTAKLNFPGPVRQLVTHGQPTLDALGTVGVPAGGRVFAILDEEKCGGASCGGIVAVDTLYADSASGGFPVSKANLPDGGVETMQALTIGDSLPVGLTIGVNTALLPTDGGPTVTQLLTPTGDGGAELRAYPALGVITAANGDVVFFDATTLLQIDGNDDVAHANGVRYFDSDGIEQQTYLTGIDAGTDSNNVATAISVADGVWRSQGIFTYWEGVLTDVPVVVSSSPTTHLSVPSGVASRFLVGDIVVFQMNSYALCADATVTEVGADFITIDAVPPGCTDVASFIVRSGPAKPFAIFRTQVPTYLGRAKAGDTFVWNNDGVYVRLSGYDPSKPALTMSFGFDTDVTVPERGSFWQFAVNNAYLPFALIIDSTVACIAQLPGKAIFDPVRARIYVLYPSGNGLVDLDPSLAQRGAVGSINNTYCYH